ncbi:MAG: DDE-type integrase/transposase/recombinase [Planctomycetes bacterium]|nr:DDE-type integrase/transposase/recombinase [Planctomycetota bacterium]
MSDAAPLLGVSAAHLRRSMPRLAALGMARQFPVSGGKSWHLHRDHDPRLRRRAGGGDDPLPRPNGGEGPGEGAGIDLAAIDPPCRELALKRLAAVAEYRRRRDTDPDFTARRDTAALCAQLSDRLGIEFKERTLRLWHTACPDITKANRTECVLALLDGRGSAPGGRRPGITPAAWACFERLYLTPQRRSVKACYEMTAAQAKREGWSWPSLTQVRRAMKDRITPERDCRAREGDTAWRRKCQPAMAQDPDSHAAGERWDGDHATLDFYIRVRRGGQWVATRPTLTAWMDWRSRRLVGWHIGLTPSSQTIRLALVRALRDPAISAPKLVKIDHGKDYESAATTGRTKKQWQRARREGDLSAPGAADPGEAMGLLPLLGIEVRFGTPYNPNAKARIERLFGLIHERFDREQRSYCGQGPTAVAPEIKAALLKDPAALPTLDEVRERFEAFVSWCNGRGEHGIDDLIDGSTGERLSPAAYYDAHLPVRRELLDPSMLELLAQRFTRPLKAGKRGVGFTPPGATRKVYFGEHRPELRPYINCKTSRLVASFDESDLSAVRLWDAATMRHVCTAPMNEFYGAKASAGAIAEAQRRRKRAERAVRESMPQRLLESEADAIARAQRDDDVDATRARLAEAGIEPSSDAPVRIVRTPLDGQSESIERHELRQAAGGEFDPSREDEDPDIRLPGLSLTDFDDDDDEDDIDFTEEFAPEFDGPDDDEDDDADPDWSDVDHRTPWDGDFDDDEDDIDLIAELGKGGVA